MIHVKDGKTTTKRVLSDLKKNVVMRKYFSKTQNLDRRYEKWTKEEDLVIITSPLNDYDLAKVIQRSQHSISVRRSILRSERRLIVYDNNGYAPAPANSKYKNLRFVI